jgi:hypothetical protein
MFKYRDPVQVAKGTGRVGIPIRSGVAALGILLVAMSSSAAPNILAAPRQADSGLKPSVVIVSPPDCPLRISITGSSRLSSHVFDLDVLLANSGVLPITGYMITHSEYDGQSRVGSGSGGCFEGVLGSTDFPIGLGQSNEERLGIVFIGHAFDRVELAIDFIEFTDRTTWGPDQGRNAQILSGMRAGAREAQAYLRGVFQFAGSEGLTSALAAEHLPLGPPKNRDPQWERGFRTGADTIHTRAKQAMNDSNIDEVKSILNRPLDF